MIRSGKNPRHKDSSANNDETKQDIISRLPDPLLTDILSLLPPSDVKQTRLVSKRWKNLFALLPNIFFHMKSCPSVEQVKNFHVFVDQTLAIRGCIPIEKLLLKCEKKYDYDCFYDMLCTLVRFKAGIRELELMSPPLFLEERFIKFANEESVVNLISGCPVLEELYVERNGFDDRLEVFNISSLSLKRLRIDSYNQTGYYKVVIDAPKLEYIYIHDTLTNHCSMTKPLCLVEAEIYHSSRVISQLIPFLSSAKILNLTPRSTWVEPNMKRVKKLLAYSLKLLFGLCMFWTMFVV